MALAMKMDVASNPVAIRLLGADAVVLETDAFPDAVEQENGRHRLHGTEPFGPPIGKSSDDSEEICPVGP